MMIDLRLFAIMSVDAYVYVYDGRSGSACLEPSKTPIGASGEAPQAAAPLALRPFDLPHLPKHVHLHVHVRCSPLTRHVTARIRRRGQFGVFDLFQQIGWRPLSLRNALWLQAASLNALCCAFLNSQKGTACHKKNRDAKP